MTYNFKIGDKVITDEGITGVITDICTCDRCKERGFYEPTWVSDEDGEIGWETITDYIAKRNFYGYYQIGEYRFNNFDKDAVLRKIQYSEKILEKMKKRLEVIESLEG